MTLKVVFLRAARAEFDAAALWYDLQHAGLGLQFVSEINRVIDLVTTRSRPEAQQCCAPFTADVDPPPQVN